MSAILDDEDTEEMHAHLDRLDEHCAKLLIAKAAAEQAVLECRTALSGLGNTITRMRRLLAERSGESEAATAHCKVAS